eukprot:jgi/Chrpa1/15282/Chrysochromulina_OHIO_Genome00008322-RA
MSSVTGVFPQYQACHQCDAESWLPSPHFRSHRLDDERGTVLTHTRVALLGGSDAALGRLVMTADVLGVHRFTLTVASSRSTTGTKIRVGVANADGTRVCGIRPWDGQLFPRPTRVGHPSAVMSDPYSDGSPRYLFLNRTAVGREVEVRVDFVRRRLTFRLDGEGDVDSRVPGSQLPDSLRPWVQCAYEGDAVVLSRYSFTPYRAAPTTPRATSPYGTPVPPSPPQTNAFGSATEAAAAAALEDDVDSAHEDDVSSPSPRFGASTGASTGARTAARTSSPSSRHAATLRSPSRADSRRSSAEAAAAAAAAAADAISTSPSARLRVQEATMHAWADESARARRTSGSGCMHMHASDMSGLVQAAAAEAAEAEAAATLAEERAQAAEAKSARLSREATRSTSRGKTGTSPALAQSPPPTPPPSFPGSHAANGLHAATCAAKTPHSRSGPSSSFGAPPRALKDVWEPEMAATRSQVGLISMAAIKNAVATARKEAAMHSSFAAAAAKVEEGTRDGYSYSGALDAYSRSPAGVGGLLGPTGLPVEWTLADWLLRGQEHGGEPKADKANPEKPWERPNRSRHTNPKLPATTRIAEVIAAAVTAPLRMERPPAPLTLAYLRALAAQPDRRLAVERLLRDGKVIESIAHEICLAADAIVADLSLGATLATATNGGCGGGGRAGGGSGSASPRGLAATPGAHRSDTKPLLHSPARGGTPSPKRTGSPLAARGVVTPPPPSPGPPKSHLRLEELRELRDAGRMTQSEFVERRREVLDAFLAEKPVEVVSLTEEETAQSRAVDR